MPQISKAQARRELRVGRNVRLIDCLVGPTPEGKGYRTVTEVKSSDIVMHNHDNGHPSYLTCQCTHATLEGNVLTFHQGEDRIAAAYELDCEKPSSD